MKSEEIDLHDIVSTPDGELKVQLIQYDPKTKKTFYAKMGSKGVWYDAKDCKLIRKARPKRKGKKK